VDELATFDNQHDQQIGGLLGWNGPTRILIGCTRTDRRHRLTVPNGRHRAAFTDQCLPRGGSVVGKVSDIEKGFALSRRR